MSFFLFLGIFFVCLSLFISASSVALAAADHVLINEIQTDSFLGTGGTADDWIELYNPTDSPINLTDWSIQKHSASSTSTISKKVLSGTIPAKGYFLIVRGDTTNTLEILRKMADNLTAASFSLSDDNTVYLVKNGTTIDGKNDADIVDFVGFGEAESFEGTAPADNPQEAKSISRKILGDDSDDNSIDFVTSEPTAQNSSSTIQEESDLSGSVLLTVTPATLPVVNITSTGAEILFLVNSTANAKINYGLTDAYGQVSNILVTSANVESKIVLSGLACGTTYHYAIYAETDDQSDSHATADATFETLPCGIRLDSLIMTKASARADNNYADGWKWVMQLTVWDLSETSLKLKFEDWTGLATIQSGGNMRYSADGMNWINISASNDYPASGLSIAGFDEDSSSAGRQVSINIEMKLPIGTSIGKYGSNYTLLTEKPEL